MQKKWHNFIYQRRVNPLLALHSPDVQMDAAMFVCLSVCLSVQKMYTQDGVLVTNVTSLMKNARLEESDSNSSLLKLIIFTNEETLSFTT
jgi:hypothetical protein